MPIKYGIALTLGVVNHEFTGEIELADFEQHWRRFLAGPESPYPLIMFADMRACRIAVHGDDTRYLVRTMIEPLLGGRRWISAVVVASSCDHGVTKQFIAYSDKFGDTEVFLDVDEAVRWLAAKTELSKTVLCPEPDDNR